MLRIQEIVAKQSQRQPLEVFDVLLPETSMDYQNLVNSHTFSSRTSVAQLHSECFEKV